MTSKFRLSSASRQVTWVHFHWNYTFISNFSYWKARQLASKIVATLSEQSVSQASYFENCLFRIKQLTTLFAAQEVLYWFRVSHLYITMQCSQSNCNSIVLLRSDFASIFITPPSLIDSAPQMQLCSWLSASILQVYVRMDKQLSLLYGWHFVECSTS